MPLSALMIHRQEWYTDRKIVHGCLLRNSALISLIKESVQSWKPSVREIGLRIQFIFNTALFSDYSIWLIKGCPIFYCRFCPGRSPASTRFPFRFSVWLLCFLLSSSLFCLMNVWVVSNFGERVRSERNTRAFPNRKTRRSRRELPKISCSPIC